MTARPLLAAAFALAVLAPALASAQDVPPEPAPPLRSGPMLGYVALRSGALWLQTTRPAEVVVRYLPAGHPEQARLTAPRTTGRDEDCALTLVLDGLEPGTRYEYEVYLDGERVARPYPLTFATRPLWEWRTDPPALTLLVGSCAYFNEPPVDRPGTPYGGEHEVFEAMAKVPADAMIWMGDNTYLREVDYETREGIAARYRRDRAQPCLQRLLAAMPNYAIWDDHDYGPNDSDRTYPLKDVSLRTFARYWPAPALGMPGVPGVFQLVHLSDVDLFLLDDRTYRDPDDAPAEGKTCLGRGQLDWLKAALCASGATFKLVVCGNQVLNDRTPYEALGAVYPLDVAELTGWIARQRIEGVVFVTGDRHHTELLRREVAGGYPLYDFTSSPLTAGVHTFGPEHPEWNHPERVSGSLIQARGFGVVSVTGPRKARVLTLEARGVDGAMRYRREIPRQELSFPKDPAAPKGE